MSQVWQLIRIATISQSGTWPIIYSPKKHGKALSREIQLSERQLLLSFRQPWRPRRKSVWIWRWKRRRKQKILPKRGGILSILPWLRVLSLLAGGVAGIVKAVNDNKAVQRQLEELKCHNRVMEGHGIYLRTSADEGYRRKKNVNRTQKMLKGVTTDVQLRQLAKSMCDGVSPSCLIESSSLFSKGRY